jgi:hypothetical protein
MQALPIGSPIMAQSSLPPVNPGVNPGHPEYVDREVIILNQEGVWIADDSEITHEPTRRLFARSLKKDSKGYFLSIGRETKRIEVEDTAYFVERIVDNQGDQKIELSDGTQELLDPSTLRYSPGRLTCRIKNGEEEAKFLRVPYYEILRDLEENGGKYFIHFNGKKVPL